MPREEINDKNIHLKNLYEGLVMTKAQLQMVFKRHGLEAVDPSENEKFDPNFHEALYQKVSCEYFRQTTFFCLFHYRSSRIRNLGV